MKVQDLPRDKHYKYFMAAFGAAFLCPGNGGNGGNRFRLGATLIRKKEILAVKNNSAKTHPKLLPFYKFPFLHSESNAIISYGLDNCEDTILYVLRILKTNELAMAKPCNSCMLLIKHCKIKQVYFTTGEGIGIWSLK